jgi:hypothetical protein
MTNAEVNRLGFSRNHRKYEEKFLLLKALDFSLSSRKTDEKQRVSNSSQYYLQSADEGKVMYPSTAFSTIESRANPPRAER